MVSNKNINKTYSFPDKLEKRKTYLVRDKNKHFRKSKNLMPLSWCHLSAAAILAPPSRCHHPDAIVLTQLYWCHPLNATLLIQPFSCCYPQTALLILLSSHCHWKFIVAYKKWSAKTILNKLTVFQVSWKKERHKWLETQKNILKSWSS